GLVRAFAFDCAGEVRWIVGYHADRVPLHPGERGHHTGAEVPANFEHRASIRQRLDDGADVVNAQPILGNDRAEQALVGTFPIPDRALEVGEILFGNLYRLGFIVGRDIDAAVANLHVHRADLFGAEDAESAALDHRGTAHSDIGVGGRDNDVAASEYRGIAG